MNTHLIELYLRRAVLGRDFLDPPVMVLEELKIAYVPLMKVANTSLRAAMLKAAGRDDLEKSEVWRASKTYLEKSRSFFGRATPEWFVFTVVRDPTRRAISAWKNKLAEPDEVFPPLRRMGATKQTGFEAFLDMCAAWPVWALNDHFRPQTRLLERALAYAPLQVYHFETLGQDWDNVRDQMRARGLKNPPTLDFLNQTKKNTQPELSATATARLGTLYQADYARFGYPHPVVEETQ